MQYQNTLGSAKITRAYHAVLAMPSVASSNDDSQEQQRQQQQTQPYIPRLSYRHASAADICHTPRVSVASAYTVPAAQPVEKSIPPSLRSPSGQTAPMTSPKLPLGPSSPRSNPTTKSLGSPGTPTKATKTKGASLFGFLTVKEPSARALLEYEEHVRKQAQTRNGRVTSVGMSGISSAKLPVTVPKVNSKWDGVPQAIKEKEKEKEKEAHKRHSTASAGRSFRAGLSAITHGGSDHAHSSSSTLDSEASRRNAGAGSSIFSSQSASQSSLGTKSSVENGSISGGSDTKDLHCRSNSQSLRSHSSTTLAEISSVTSAGSANRMMRTEREGRLSTEFGRFPPVPRLTESYLLRSVGSAESVASSPLPFTTASSRGAVTPTSHKDNTANTATPVDFAQADVSIKSSGADVLGPPATMRIKANLQPLSTGEAGSMYSAQAEPSHSILRREASQTESTGPSRPPMSSYFTHSVVERAEVGQSPRSRMSTASDMVAPWETEGPASRPDTERVSTPAPQNGRGLLKRGRLAIFNK